MTEYREVRPPVRLAKHVECFWTSRAPCEGEHRVLPDGCTDLVFRTGGGAMHATAVGAMTRPLLTFARKGEEVFGVRFHPAMSHGLLRAPIADLTDQVIDLEALWGRDARALEQRLADAPDFEERVAVIESALKPPPERTPVQRAAVWIVECAGDTDPEELARHAGLSARQLRRLCIEQTGVGPKMLCRIVRFRGAANQIAARATDWASFALDHGYYDQAHFINEFREFSGLTPSEYASSVKPLAHARGSATR